MTERCLGKLARRHDPRTLRLATLLTSALPQPPERCDWAEKLPDDVGMMANDRLGDCTCAGAGHLVQAWTANRLTEVTISDEDVVAAYAAITGYTPSDPDTDAGAVLLDVLNYWRRIGVGGHVIGAYAFVNHTDPVELCQALSLFGGLYTGVQLPLSAQGAIGSTWSDTSDEPGGWGGHCMALVGYDADGVTYLTWGKRQRATWDWVAKYADEMYALVSADWVDGTAPAPSGFDVEQLRADLEALR